MPAEPYIPLPLARFFARLQAAGFTLDPARERQLRMTLYEEGGNYLGRFGELKYLLAPYVAQTGREQTDFYRLWDEFVAECVQEAADYNRRDDPQENTDRASAPVTDRPRKQRWWPWLFLLPFMALVSYFYFTGFLGKEDPVTISFSPPLNYLPREGQTIRYENTTSTGPKDSLGFEWTVRDLGSREILHTANSFHLNWVLPEGSCRRIQVLLKGDHLYTGDEPTEKSLHTVVLCDAPPPLEELRFPEGPFSKGERIRFGVERQDSTLYRWQFGENTPYVYGPSVSWVFPEEGDFMVELKAMSVNDSVCCYTQRIRKVQVGSNLPLLAALPLSLDKPRQYLRVAKWVWGLMLLPLIIALFFWLDWRKKRRRAATIEVPATEQLQAAYPVHDTGPYDIPYRSQAAAISVPADFFRIADQLRIREEGLRRHFDGRSTVEATVRRGGFPVWRDRAIKRPAEYLLLVRHTDDRQQQDRLLARLGEFLVEREAALSVYFHSGRFDRFWNADHPDGYSPEQLVGRYPDYRLIILGNAHGLLDPYESAEPRLLPRWQALFTRWRRRLVLTTEPVVDWSYQEILLHRYFLLYPVDTRGIRRGIDALNATEDYDAADFKRWEAELSKRHPEPSYRYRRWDTVDDHRDYLADDPELFRWLCGLAVCSQPEWNLTIAIGRALGIEVTHNRLLRLSRIPWLADNRPDHRLRLALLALLPAPDEKLARQAVLTELAAVKAAVSDSFAQAEWTATRAVQAFSLAPHEPDNKQSIRELRQLGLLTNDQLDELDQKLRGQAQDSPNTAATQATPHLDDWLNRAEKPPWFTMDLFLSIVFGLVGLVAIFAAWDYNRQGHLLEDGRPVSGWQRTENVDDLALRLNNEAVETMRDLDTVSNYQTFTLAAPRWVTAITKLDSALKLRKPELYAVADTNKFNGYVNLQRKYLNFGLLGAVAPDSLEKELSALLRDLKAYEATHEERTEALKSRNALLAAHVMGVAALWYYTVDTVEDESTGGGFIDLFGDDFMLEIAEDIYTRLDSVSNGTFFPSIAESMPVNLETMLRKIWRDTLTNGQDRVDPPPPRDDNQDEQNNDERNSTSVTGRLVNRKGQAVRGATVNMLLESGRRNPFPTVTTTDASGAFSLKIPLRTNVFSLQINPATPELPPERLSFSLPDNGNLGNIVMGQQDLGNLLDQDPFLKMINDYKELPYTESIVGRNVNLELSSYLQSYLNNSLDIAVSDVSGLSTVLKRDISGITSYEVDQHTANSRFLLFGRPGNGAIPSELEPLKGKSYALLVSVSNYDSDQLTDLPETDRQTRALGAVLERLGFEVEILYSPTLSEFSRAGKKYDDGFKSGKYPQDGQFLLYMSGYFGKLPAANIAQSRREAFNFYFSNFSYAPGSTTAGFSNLGKIPDVPILDDCQHQLAIINGIEPPDFSRSVTREDDYLDEVINTLKAYGVRELSTAEKTALGYNVLLLSAIPLTDSETLLEQVRLLRSKTNLPIYLSLNDEAAGEPTWVISVGDFSQRYDAETFMKRLGTEDFDLPITVNNNTLYTRIFVMEVAEGQKDK